MFKWGCRWLLVSGQDVLDLLGKGRYRVGQPLLSIQALLLPHLDVVQRFRRLSRFIAYDSVGSRPASIYIALHVIFLPEDHGNSVVPPLLVQPFVLEVRSLVGAVRQLMGLRPTDLIVVGLVVDIREGHACGEVLRIGEDDFGGWSIPFEAGMDVSDARVVHKYAEPTGIFF